MTYRVWKQIDPLPTSRKMWEGGREVVEHEPRLMLLGHAGCMEEAKRLCVAPILEKAGRLQ